MSKKVFLISLFFVFSLFAMNQENEKDKSMVQKNKQEDKQKDKKEEYKKKIKKTREREIVSSECESMQKITSVEYIKASLSTGIIEEYFGEEDI